MKALKRIEAISLAIMLCLCSIPGIAFAEEASKEQVEGGKYVFTGDSDSYLSYFTEYCDEDYGSNITVGLDALSAAQKSIIRSESGKQGVLVGESNEWAEFTVNITQSAVYSVNVSYFNLKGSDRSIEFALSVDGEYPYSELEALSLPRIWRDVADQETGETILQDSMGNDRLPDTEEVNRWNEIWLWDSQGYYEEPYFIYLTEGRHTIRFTTVIGDFLLGSFELGREEQSVSYAEYFEANKNKPDNAENTDYWQTENYSVKNSAQIYSGSEKSSAATMPSSPVRKRINIVGGSNWKYSGQSLTWEIEIEESGFYELAFRYRQDVNQGMTSYRRLLIDDKLLFNELKNIPFEYTLDWKIKTVGDDEPYLFYFEKGRHTLTLSVSPGELCGVLRDVKKAVLDLTQIYRSIVMVTGSSPDIYRDYSLEKQIPGLKDGLADIKDRLVELSNDIAEVTGTSGTIASGIDETAVFLGELIDKSYEIPERISRFSDLITSIGSLLLQLSEQPLELDYFATVAGEGERPQAEAGFFESLGFGLKRFLSSYAGDYNNISSAGGYEKEILVWVSCGRDQAQVLESLITDDFSPNYGIGVNLSLVNTGTVLIQATLAGKGPDVALMVTHDLPVNLAMRGALVDLSQFDLTKLNDEIQPNAWNSYIYNGGIYAVPETQIFDMLFYRTDIFESLGITPPDTWEQFYDVLTVLQQNNLQVAIPETSSATPGISVGITTFDKFLYQSGGKYFNDDLSATLFDTNIAADAFIKWTELYTKYGLEREVNFYNRFRTGEVAMGIQTYNMYNQLTAAAPELKGLWGMALIPGTPKEDGSIDRSQTSTGTAAIMLNSCLEKGIENEAFEFIEWWTGSETQAVYGNRLESIMGVAARYTPANTVAMESLGWTGNEYKILTEQWKSVTAVEQIPGSYVISRSLTSAFRTSVDEDLDARRQLLIYNNDMNSEISRKRREFHLDEHSGGAK